MRISHATFASFPSHKRQKSQFSWILLRDEQSFIQSLSEIWIGKLSPIILTKCVDSCISHCEVAQNTQKVLLFFNSVLDIKCEKYLIICSLKAVNRHRNTMYLFSTHAMNKKFNEYTWLSTVALSLQTLHTLLPRLTIREWADLPLSHLCNNSLSLSLHAHTHKHQRERTAHITETQTCMHASELFSLQVIRDSVCVCVCV